MQIRIRQNDADPAGFGSTTLIKMTLWRAENPGVVCERICHVCTVINPPVVYTVGAESIDWSLYVDNFFPV